MITLYFVKSKTCVSCKPMLAKVKELLEVDYPEIKLKVLDIADNDGFDFANTHDVENVPRAFLNDGNDFFYPVSLNARNLEAEIDEYLEKFC